MSNTYQEEEERDGRDEGLRRRDIARDLDRRIRRLVGAIDYEELDDEDFETFEPIRRRRR